MNPIPTEKFTNPTSYMNRYSGTIVCLAYSIGLLSTGIFTDFSPWWSWGIRIAGWGILTIGAMIIMPRFWWLSPPRKVWAIAGLVALLGSIYFQFRTPYPAASDISQVVAKRAREMVVTGNTLSESRLNRKGNLQFWLQVQGYSVNDLPRENATGKLYVTLPDREENRVYPGQKVTIGGLLYKPRKPDNPSAFDFQQYLARQGAFAGLRGKKIIEKSPPPIGVWRIRDRIARSQIQGLGEDKGALLSSITLGRGAIDLPFKIQELFIKTGLAHVLAASGFHVALLLGVVLGITKKLSPRTQFIIGISVLLFYLALTGLQPSVARAVLMGIGGLIGIVLNRRTDAIGSLVVAATILLILNPLWINDLGFQLSFLATFGLIVTAPPIQKQLDFLPSILSEPSAITLAATLWTLPLLLHTFSSIALYSLITNVITNPLVVIVSLGGIFSAFLALVYPPLGSLSASILYYPIELLLQILKFFTSLPMSVLATGKLSLGVMVILYGLLGLLTVNPRFQKKWYLVGLFMIGLILIPIVYQSLTLTRVTVFATKNEPAIVIQDRGKTILIGGNDPDTARYTVIPFLREQGINQIQEAIALDPNANRTAIQEEIPIDREITVTKGNINSIAFQSDRSSLQFQLQGKTWLLITDNKNFSSLSVKPFALLWKGKSIDKKWLETLKPRVAIASSFSRATRQDLKNLNIDYFQTGRDGAIQWTPRQGFQRFIEEDRSPE